MSGKYGSNQWKIRLFNALFIIIILIIIGGACIFIKSKYEAYQVVKREEERKYQEELEKEERLAEKQRKEEEKAAEEQRKKEEEERLAKEEEEKKASEKKYVSEYEVVVSDATWREASGQAESRGGHLAVIDSREEEKTIQELIKQKSSIHTVWLGGTLKDESFVWVNGEEFKYTNWGPGEPNNETADEFYLDMYEIDGVWYWNDAPNDIKQYYSGRMGYVIEWEVEQ